jgi:hypothetical protein
VQELNSTKQDIEQLQIEKNKNMIFIIVAKKELRDGGADLWLDLV